VHVGSHRLEHSGSEGEGGRTSPPSRFVASRCMNWDDGRWGSEVRMSRPARGPTAPTPRFRRTVARRSLGASTFPVFPLEQPRAPKTSRRPARRATHPGPVRPSPPSTSRQAPKPLTTRTGRAGRAAGRRRWVTPEPPVCRQSSHARHSRRTSPAVVLPPAVRATHKVSCRRATSPAPAAGSPTAVRRPARYGRGRGRTRYTGGGGSGRGRCSRSRCPADSSPKSCRTPA